MSGIYIPGMKMPKGCVDCPYFIIRQPPLRAMDGLYDLGLAECGKHNLVIDFADNRKLNRLECVEKEEGNGD